MFALVTNLRMKVRHYIPPRAMHNQDIFPDDEDPRELFEVLGGGSPSTVGSVMLSV